MRSTVAVSVAQNTPLCFVFSFKLFYRMLHDNNATRTFLAEYFFPHISSSLKVDSYIYLMFWTFHSVLRYSIRVNSSYCMTGNFSLRLACSNKSKWDSYCKQRAVSSPSRRSSQVFICATTHFLCARKRVDTIAERTKKFMVYRLRRALLMESHMRMGGANCSRYDTNYTNKTHRVRVIMDWMRGMCSARLLCSFQLLGDFD